MSHSIIRIAFLTYCDRPNLTEDDQRAAHELEQRGIAVFAVPWDAPNSVAQLQLFDAAVVRSTWNYTERHQKFARWIEQAEAAGVRLLNSAATLLWNTDKIYLRALQEKGHEVMPTRWVARGTRLSLADALATLDSAEAVVKPRISATAKGLFKTSQALAAADQQKLDALLKQHDVMLQPFAQEIVDHGEWSFIYFGGSFSHAVVKRARAGDHRVQSNFGGTHVSAMPPQPLLDTGQRLVDECTERFDEIPLYARVDGIVRDGEFVLMELELIEPELFFRADDGAPARFADALTNAFDTSMIL